MSQNRKAKNPISPESNKASYMILRVGFSNYSRNQSQNHFVIGNKIAENLGVKLSSIIIENKEHPNSTFLRYLFRFPYFQRNDKLATHFVESFFLAISYAYGPFLDVFGEPLLFRIPRSLLKDRKSIYSYELLQIEKARQWSERISEFPESTFGSYIDICDNCIADAWKLTPLLFNRQYIFNAFRFLKTSQDFFYVYPGQYDDILFGEDSSANNANEQSSLEHALQESFKAIEAIIGDPPRNDENFFAKLKSININPFETFGVENKPIFQVIRDINTARDKKAAHGSTRNRTISTKELFIFQNCARYVISQACENLLGEKL